MAKVTVAIEVEETGVNKWSAWDPITGDIETRPTKWQAIQAIAARIVQRESVTLAVNLHGQGSSSE